GDPRMNMVLRNRDSIVVPVDVGLFYMMGQVKRPGPYAFNERDITLKHAIATVVGCAPLGSRQHCESVRKERGTGKQLTIPVRLAASVAGLAPDIGLKDEEIVNVGTHLVAPFLFVIRNSFRFTYGFGFVYGRNFADQDSYGSRDNPQSRA